MPETADEPEGELLIASKQQLMRIAAVLVDDAVHGRNKFHRFDPVAMRLFHILQSKYYTIGFGAVALGMQCLALYEVPSTLYDVIPALWPLWLTTTLDLLCLALLSVDVAVRYRFMGRKSFMRNKWTRARAAFISFAVVNVVLSVSTNMAVPRLWRLFRPVVIIAHYRNVQKIFGNMVRPRRRMIRTRTCPRGCLLRAL